jgi:glycosyltransferase involved in cell wall biosynthesis
LDSVVEGLATCQVRRGNQVAVAALEMHPARETPGLGRMRTAGVMVHRIRLGSRGYLQEWRLFADVCRRVKPDVVHTHGVRTDIVDGMAARFLGLPTVTTLHGRTGGGLKWRFMEWLQYGLAGRFDAIAAVSQPQVDYLSTRGAPKNRVHLVRNAWVPSGEPLSRTQARQALGVSETAILIGWVGRLSREKGPDVFVDALALVGDLPFQVAVLGDGSERADLEKRARNHGLDQRIQWHGTVPDARRFFKAFDLFVLSSRTEGTPITLFEALATRVPVVATRVGGVPDVISEREALLVPSENVAALAHAIRTVISDPASARERAELALAYVNSEFGADRWVESYDRLYDLVCARSRGHAAESR